VEPKIKAVKKFAKNNFVSLNPLNSLHSFINVLDPTALKQQRLFNGFLQLFS